MYLSCDHYGGKWLVGGTIGWTNEGKEFVKERERLRLLWATFPHLTLLSHTTVQMSAWSIV